VSRASVAREPYKCSTTASQAAFTAPTSAIVNVNLTLTQR
jgi:hypothetical protein